MLSGVGTHPPHVSKDGSLTPTPKGLAVGYDLVDVVNQFRKFRNLPKDADGVVEKFANFSNFHESIQKCCRSHGTATTKTKGQASGGSLFFTELNSLRCLEDGSTYLWGPHYCPTSLLR